MAKEGDNGQVKSVGTIGQEFSDRYNRSVWINPQIYGNLADLQTDWRDFLRESRTHNDRRTLLKCMVTAEVVEQLTLLGRPLVAVLPAGDSFIVYLEENQHPQLSPLRTDGLPPAGMDDLLPLYQIGTEVTQDDAAAMYGLWAQFGWELRGVQAFVEAQGSGSAPLAVIRYLDAVVGIMIAESMQFGSQLIVEITEMAVDPEHKGHHLASHLIRYLTQLSFEQYGPDALVFGEYNMTTGAHRTAARAGHVVGNNRNRRVPGVLHDHVTIDLGENHTPNRKMRRWDTRWLHNFMVMYHQPENR